MKFRGPIQQHDTAESLRQALREMTTMMPDASITVHRRYEDEDSICMYYDFHTGTPLGSITNCEVFMLKNGLIKEIHLVFNASNFRQMMEQHTDR